MSATFLIGDRYGLAELLGVGGSAAVYAAHDTRGGGQVAVKLLHPHLCADDAHRRAFLAEAAKVEQVQHPNVIRVHGSGLHDAAGILTPWIAFDLLTGPTLHTRVATHGTLNTTDAAAIVAGVLSGLAAAHRSGLIHRDLNPHNIIIEPPADGSATDRITSDMVRLVDFGLADITGQTTVGGDVLLAHEDNNDSGVIGTAHYMSPEQALGKPVRAASDLYQAGAVLSFALTGLVPFPGRSSQDTLAAHITAPPPVPSAIVAGTAAFDKIVAKAMAKTPAHRYRNADEFRLALIEAITVDSHVPDEATPQTSNAAPTPTATLPYPPATTPPDADAPAPPPPDGATAYPSHAASTGLTATVAVLVVAGLVGLTAWGVLTGTPPPQSTPTTSPSPPTITLPPSEPPTAPVIQAPPTPQPTEPLTIAVPALTGTLAQARDTLHAVGLVLGQVDRINGPATADQVLAQQIPVGGQVAPGSAIGVAVSSGYNAVPTVTGLTADAAIEALQAAGFTVAALASGDMPADALIADSAPAEGAIIRVGSEISLRVLPNPTPQPSDTPAPGH